jgi:hypothetical protein
VDVGNEMANEFRIKNGVSIGSVVVIDENGEWVGPVIRTPYVNVTNNYTARSGERILADTSGGAFSITLPATPSAGDNVKISGTGSWDTNNLTILNNSVTIEGFPTGTITLDTSQLRLEFIYDGLSWKVYGLETSDVEGREFVPKYPVQVETGDGTTETFNLINQVDDEQQLLVTVAGVLQTPGSEYSYIASGNTLVFHEAPNPDDRIVIRYLIYKIKAIT